MNVLVFLLILISLVFTLIFLKTEGLENKFSKIPLFKAFSCLSVNFIIILNILLLTSFVNTVFSRILAFLAYITTEIILYFLVKHIKFDTLFIVSIIKNSTKIAVLSAINIILAILGYIFLDFLSKNILHIIILDLYFLFSITITFFACNILYSKQKIDNLRLCNKTILTLYDDTRAFKHDFNNIIQAIGGYIETDDLTNLKSYYHSILEDSKDLNNLSKLNPEIINNPAIYNVLANKYYIANDNNIVINLEILLDLNKLNISSYELSRILGILLDNAIEASKECTKKKINISFKKDNSKQMLIIENTYNNKQVSIDKIFEKNYTTKPNNTGLGLWEVRKILNKDSHLNLYTSKTNDYFSQQLEIYNTG